MPPLKRPARRLQILFGVVMLLALGGFAFLRVAQSPLRWSKVAMEMDLPPSIQVYSAAATIPSTAPRAWYVDIDTADKNLQLVPWLSRSPSGREQGSAMATGQKAIVAINGGYFDMESVPARMYSLVLRDGKMLSPNIPIVHRSSPTRAYPVTRSAFGIDANGNFDVAWVAQIGQQLWAYPSPVPHTVAKVAGAPSTTYPAGGHPWNMMQAIGGGPTLMSDGQLQDTYENEVFFDSGFPGDAAYSRAAIGYTPNHHLILFVTDGRHISDVEGLTLAGLAAEMQRLGCVEAMNLDGGGSETLVINGQTINQAPRQARDITAILAITPKN
ncbi:hypothetical protein IAD21_03013 [Abditibacteriota bacterium]|nr:hypothetical protein IAD21_03013 [Abditibacteriota bacterium]